MLYFSIIRFVSFCFCMAIVFPSLSDRALVAGDPVSDELASFGKNKTIPDEMQKVILTALSFYPDLASTRIHFIYEENIRKSVMQARPKVSSILRRKSKRVYVVKISRYLKLNRKKLDIFTLPFEVLVGWIGHELGHIMDYKDRSGMAMIGFGAKYCLFEGFLMKAERRADLFALEHGLGEKIIKTKNFVLDHVDIPERYKERVKRLYMSPEEFMQMLSEAAP